MTKQEKNRYHWILDNMVNNILYLSHSLEQDSDWWLPPGLSWDVFLSIKVIKNVFHISTQLPCSLSQHCFGKKIFEAIFRFWLYFCCSLPIKFIEVAMHVLMLDSSFALISLMWVFSFRAETQLQRRWDFLCVKLHFVLQVWCWYALEACCFSQKTVVFYFCYFCLATYQLF